MDLATEGGLARTAAALKSPRLERPARVKAAYKNPCGGSCLLACCNLPTHEQGVVSDGQALELEDAVKKRRESDKVLRDLRTVNAASSSSACVCRSYFNLPKRAPMKAVSVLYSPVPMYCGRWIGPGAQRCTSRPGRG